MLGIILTFTMTTMKITTAEECTSSGNSLPLLVHIITTAIGITVRKLVQINIEYILCISYSIIIIRILQKRIPCAIKGGPRSRVRITLIRFSQSFKVVTLVIQRSLVLLFLIILELTVCFTHYSHSNTTVLFTYKLLSITKQIPHTQWYNSKYHSNTYQGVQIHQVVSEPGFDTLIQKIRSSLTRFNGDRDQSVQHCC